MSSGGITFYVPPSPYQGMIFMTCDISDFKLLYGAGKARPVNCLSWKHEDPTFGAQ